jgi:8-oxo-dGTP pyrophosphatase MutT (NUDIX family)
MKKIIIASGPVIVEDNKVLLNQHGDTEFWKFCGGRVENFDDNLIEAAKREAREEMGIGIEILDENPFLLHTIKKTPEVDMDIILVHYLAKRIGDILPVKDIREWKWIHINNLEKENLAPNIFPALKHFGFIK